MPCAARHAIRVSRGIIVLPALLRLSDEDREFVRDFVLCRGSLKEMAREMGLSYPTVRNKLDDVIDHIKKLAHETSR